MNQKVQVINVIEIMDKENNNISITSFNDNEEGNNQAEQLMFELAKENGYIGSARNADEFFDDYLGLWESGTYSIYIIQSKI